MHPRLRLLVGLLLAAAAALAPAACIAADGDELRFGGGLGLGATFRLHTDQGRGLEIDRYSQNYSLSLGVDINRFVGVEVMTSQSQTDLEWGGRKIGEYGMFTLIPQVRLSSPLLDGRLTPYLVGGVGLGHNEFGDRKRAGIGLSIQGNDTRVAGAVGVGLEYRLADNIGGGGELRYLASRGHEIEIEGTRQTLNLDALLVQARLRLLFPERETRPEAAYYTDGRWYIGLRYGGALTTRDRVGDGIEAQPGLDAIGGEVDQLFAFGAGWDFAPHFGVELSFGGYSPSLAVPGIGRVAEYAMYYVIPQLRARFPVLGGRVVPYLLAGVGVGYVEVKDRKPPAHALGVRGDSVAIVGAVGGGLDYMVASNVALGLEFGYLISRGNTLNIGGHSQTVDLDALLMTGGVRIFFGTPTPR